MYAASVGKKQIGKTLVIIIAIVVLALVAIFIIGKIKERGGETASDIVGETAEQREEYLKSLGIQVDPTSSIAEVKVPDDFDERFTEYNAMLVTQGFDLTNLKGETVKKCTYTVTNKPEISDNVSVVLLVYKGKIVAAHILDNANGKILPVVNTAVEDETQEPTEETILPSEIPQAEEPAEESSVVVESAYPTE